MRTVLKALLIVATVVCLLSIGGAMMLAFPVLVPLHWLASRGSGPYGTGGWTFLAFASVFQGAWMLTYAATGNGWAGLAVAVVAAVGIAVAFLGSAADRATAGQTAGVTA